MDKEFLPKVFDTFTQEDSSRNSKYGSTGLGMAITKSIVEPDKLYTTLSQLIGVQA